MFFRCLIALSLVSVLPACGSSKKASESHTLSAEKTQSLKESALRDARATSKATLQQDWETVIKHTHPNVVEVMEGRASAIAFLASTWTEMSTVLSIDDSTIGEISDIVHEQGEYRCFIENYLTITLEGKTMKRLSHLLGFYDQEKEFWYFVNASEIKENDVSFPGFKTSLEIPVDQTL